MAFALLSQYCMFEHWESLVQEVTYPVNQESQTLPEKKGSAETEIVEKRRIVKSITQILLNIM